MTKKAIIGSVLSKVGLLAISLIVLWLGVICFGRFIMYWPPY